MGTNPVLTVGDPAPSFELESDDQGTVTLDDFAGRRFLLYFYPKDDTPGCTTQACDFRDHLSEFEESELSVVGVSPDDVESHAAFRDKYDLTFPLLADPEHEVAERYGVWREKTTYGNTYEGIVRSTFLIDEEGKIAEIHDNVRAKGHVGRLLRDLGE
jgi:peroxiredoxin Q/BCP